ncbi:MAG: EamA family transporter [Bacillota bacterium]
MKTLTIGMGPLYALVAALGFALWNLYMQRALERGVSVTANLLALSGSVAAIFLPVALWQYAQGSLPPLRQEGLLPFAVVGLVTGALGPFHSTQATRRIGAAQTTAIRLLDPLFAFLIGLLFLQERVGLAPLTGVLLIMAGLWLLQGRPQDGAPAAAGRTAGLLFALGASLLFTVGSAFRKVGMAAIPSPIVSVTAEGLTGVLVVLLATAVGRRWAEARQLFTWQARDAWLSGLSATVATLCLNLALQQLTLPVAVALRNSSPWFALLLAPLLLGSGHRSGRRAWASTLLLTLGMLLILVR